MRMTTIGLLLLASLSLCAAAPFNPYKPEIVNEDTEEYFVAKDNVEVHFHETNMSDLDAKRNGKINFYFDGAYGDVSIVNNQKGTGGAWSGWSEFGPCSATCGVATKKRERTCNGGDECPGSNEDNVDCTLSDCGAFAIDGSWTDYSAWSVCSKTCGEGERARSRTCTNPSPSDGGVDCLGQSKEIQTCVEVENCRPVYFIAGGEGATRDISVYHPTMDNVVCSSIPPTLNDWWWHITFYHDNTVHLCGGNIDTASICISHNKDTEGWKTHTITTSRRGYSSVVLHNRVYFIGGWGPNKENRDVVSTPLPLTDTPVLTPENNLDYKGIGPCVAKIDEDTLVVTGGSETSMNKEFVNSDIKTMVATYNVKTQTYTHLPPLNQARYEHGCGVLERGNSKWIIVAGGWNYGEGGDLQTTEMLQLGGSAWMTMGNLNVGRRGPSMAVTERGVMVLGGGNFVSSVELLDLDSKTWSVVEPSLHKGRRFFGGAVEIPASLFGCSG